LLAAIDQVRGAQLADDLQFSSLLATRYSLSVEELADLDGHCAQAAAGAPDQHEVRANLRLGPACARP
jgi:hypothetical protein